MTLYYYANSYNHTDMKDKIKSLIEKNFDTLAEVYNKKNKNLTNSIDLVTKYLKAMNI